MNSYLENFPEEHRPWVRNRVASCYVFEYQTYGFNADDSISLAQGPKEMTNRFNHHCYVLLDMALPLDKRLVVEKMVELGITPEVMVSIKEEVDAVWATSAEVVSDRFTKQATKKPSSKQMSFLKTLGCDVKPKTSAEASKLIDGLRSKRRYTR